ncbi:MAG TPA: methyltransferase domain-containing protein [Opitutus sp.]|nr:methyltransferase domain-containing protein [Opitutus sp.]
MIDHLLSIGPLRRAIWKRWYPYLTRKLREDDVLFLNYAFEEMPATGPVLGPADEINRGCIQLYHHVAAQADLRGKQVLEVSCGHGGGASYLTRALQPSQYTGLDLNHEGIRFCRERHRIDQLTFVQGDAENLPFENDSFDVVINVEASHCYPAFPRFLAEVTRILRPGGHFLHADFRFASGLHEWETALAATPLRPLRARTINAEVLRGMERNSARSANLIARHLPRFLQSLGRDFAGVTGSRIHTALRDDKLTYRSYAFEKPTEDHDAKA